VRNIKKLSRTFQLFFIIFSIIILSSCKSEVKDISEINIEWDISETTVFSPQNDGKGAFYPRMLISNNKDWLIAYDTNDNGKNTVCQISRSRDEGLNWETLSVASFGRGDCANAQMIQLENDDILLAYRQVDGDTKTLKLSKSSDFGENWEEYGIISQATMTDFRGVWEPHMDFLPDGKLAVMYASEIYQPYFPQVIEMKVSPDMGKTWGEPIRISDCDTSRDGMPVWTVTESNEVVVVFEATDDPSGKKPFIIRGKISPDGYNWDTERMLIYSPDNIPARAAAPYIIKSSKNHLVVSSQVDDVPDHYDMHILLSYDGKTWHKTNSAFTGVNSLWNSLYPLDDNRIIALTCVNQNNKTYIWIKKGLIS